MFKWPFSKPVAQLNGGNELTGDLALKHTILHVEKVVDNWVYGFIPGMKCYFTAKVHASQRHYSPRQDKGIDGGRISRLWISQNKDKTDPLILFEMGQWTIEPKTAMERTVVSVLVESWA